MMNKDIQISDKQIKDINVEMEDVYRIHGMVIGNMKVTGVAFIHGMVNGNIVIENDGLCYIYGIINGDVENKGKLEHYGTINGELTTIDNASTRLYDGAIIKKSSNLTRD